MTSAHWPPTPLPRGIIHVLYCNRKYVSSLFQPHRNKTQPWLPYKFHFVPPLCALSSDSWCCGAKDQKTVVGSWPCQDHRCGSRSNKSCQTGNCLCVAVTDALSYLLSCSSKTSSEGTIVEHIKRLIHASTVCLNHKGCKLWQLQTHVSNL